jgi:hypothetical protein
MKVINNEQLHKTTIKLPHGTNIQIQHSALCNEVYVTTTEFSEEGLIGQYQFTIDCITGEYHNITSSNIESIKEE